MISERGALSSYAFRVPVSVGGLTYFGRDGR